MRLYDNIAHQPLEMPKCVQLESSLQELIGRMLEKDPTVRATVGSIKTSGWFRRQLPPIAADRIHVPSSNNAPAHRPLSVYGPLQQMFGVDSNGVEIDLNGTQQTVSIPESTHNMTNLIPLSDSVPIVVDNNANNHNANSGGAIPKRNRSL